MANINWVLNVQVENGPKFVFSNPKKVVEAYDTIDVVLDDDGTTEQIVEIQPSAAAQVKFLLIKANVAATETNLTYKVSDGTDDTGSIILNEPHLYSEGMISTFLEDPPQQLKFINNTGSEVTVDILVGRDATP